MFSHRQLALPCHGVDAPQRGPDRRTADLCHASSAPWHRLARRRTPGAVQEPPMAHSYTGGESGCTCRRGISWNNRSGRSQGVRCGPAQRSLGAHARSFGTQGGGTGKSRSRRRTPDPVISVGPAEELTAPRMVAFYAGRQSLSLLTPRVAQLVERLRAERRRLHWSGDSCATLSAMQSTEQESDHWKHWRPK